MSKSAQSPIACSAYCGRLGGHREPARHGSNEDVLGSPDRRLVHECDHGAMDERAAADDRIEEGPAPPAVGDVTVRVAEDHDALLSIDDPELGALDAGERLEGRARRPPAAGAATVRRLGEHGRQAVTGT
jgi:hypothetical protein